MTGARDPDGAFDARAWIDAMRQVARQYRLQVSAETARLSDRWQKEEGRERRIRAIARHAGLQVRFARPGAQALSSWRLPVIAELADGTLAVVTAIDAEGVASLAMTGERGLQQRMTRVQYGLNFHRERGIRTQCFTCCSKQC